MKRGKDMKKYLITDLTSDYSFEIEMSDESYSVVKQIQDELGYVMEDIAIEEI